MSTYTELNLACELKQDTLPPKINALRYLLGEPVELNDLDEESRSRFEGWSGFLICSSYYFPGGALSRLHFDDITESYHLVVRMNHKNGPGINSIFLPWLAILSQTQGYVGYIRSELEEGPRLVYFLDGKAVEITIHETSRSEL